MSAIEVLINLDDSSYSTFLIIQIMQNSHLTAGRTIFKYGNITDLHKVNLKNLQQGT